MIMQRPLILGLLGITALVFANAAYAVIAIDSSAVDLSRLDVSNGKTLVELVPAKDARGIPVRLRLYGDLRLSALAGRTGSAALLKRRSSPFWNGVGHGEAQQGSHCAPMQSIAIQSAVSALH